jgi:hypothetical protein
MSRKALMGLVLVISSLIAGVSAPSALAAAFPTQTTLTSSPNPSTFGQTVTFTSTTGRTHVGSPNTPVIAGTVTFTDADSGLSSGPIPVSHEGVATWDTSALSRGTHHVTAVYSGTLDANGNGSEPSTSNTVTQRVWRIPTTLHATSSIDYVGKMAVITLRAVLRDDTGAPIADQMIVFRDSDGNVLCRDRTNMNGVARCSFHEYPSRTPLTRFTAKFRQTDEYGGSRDVGHVDNPYGGSFTKG